MLCSSVVSWMIDWLKIYTKLGKLSKELGCFLFMIKVITNKLEATYPSMFWAL